MAETGMTEEVIDVKQVFINFIKNYRSPRGSAKYLEEVRRLVSLRRRSLTIDFTDLYTYDHRTALLLVRRPQEVLEAASEALKEVIRLEDPEFAETAGKFIVRVKLNTPTRLRELRSDHIGKLVMVEGILVRATPVKEKLVRAVLSHVGEDGDEHEFTWPPEGEIHDEFELPAVCPICGGRGPFKIVPEKSMYADWQKVVIQERPEEVPPGQLPRSIEVILTRDLVDLARPGDRVSVTGILKVRPTGSLKRMGGKPPIFDMYLDAIHVDVSQKVLEEVAITREDEEKIKELAKDPWIRKRIIASIAPAIYGQWDVKEAIALALFGGNPKVLDDGTRIRGDIHVLLIGDPGTAKSLTYSEHILVMDERGLLDSRPIGELVDEYMERFRDHVVIHGETEELRLDAVGVELYTVAISPKTFKPEVKRIKALIRHRAPRRVVVVKTRLGRRAIITKEHSLIGFDKAASTLVAVRPFDALKEKMPIPILRDLAPLRRKTIRYIKIGKRRVELDWDLGYLLGFFLGSGTVTKASSGERIEMITTDLQVAEYLSRIAHRRLGTRCRIYRKRGVNREQYRLILMEKKLVEWIKANCFTKIGRRTRVEEGLDRHKRVPQVAFNAPRRFVEGMVSGLIDSSGTVIPPGLSRGKRWRGEIVFSTTNSSLAYGVSILLTILGLQHIIRYSHTTRRGKRSPHFRIYVPDPRASQVIKLVETSKRNRIALLAASGYSIVDGTPLGEPLLRTMSLLGLKSRRNDDRTFSGGIRGEMYRGYVGGKYASNILVELDRVHLDRMPEGLQVDIIHGILGDTRRLVANTLITWDIIRSVEEVDIEKIEPEHNKYVYDVSVEDHENFVGGLGNIFLHNSQLLQFVSRIAPRGIYTSGKGSSAAGLTAAVLKDKSTGEYYLEAGALVLADGGVACLHPETRVLVNNEYVSISELFREDKAFTASSKGEPVELSPSRYKVVGIRLDKLSAESGIATIVRKKQWRGELVRLTFKSGAELVVTPDHLLIDADTLEWREAGSFKAGDKVLSLQRIPGHNHDVYILDLVPNEWTAVIEGIDADHLAGIIRKLYGNLSDLRKAGWKIYRSHGKLYINVGLLRKILREAGIYNEWRAKTTIRYSRKHRSDALKVASITAELGYILGFLHGNGYVVMDNRRGSVNIVQPSKHRLVIDRLVKIIRKVTGKTPRLYVRRLNSIIKGRNVSVDNVIISVNSVLLAYIANYFLTDGLRRLPKLPDETLKAFLAGLIDSDGSISVKKSRTNGKQYKVIHVDIALENRDQVGTIPLILRRFDIYSRVKRKGKMWLIQITDREDVARLLDVVKPYSLKASKVDMPKRVKIISSRKNRIPRKLSEKLASHLINHVRPSKLLKLGAWSTLYEASQGRRILTKKWLRSLVSSIDVDTLPANTRQLLEIAINEDYYLDEVVKVEHVKYEGPVYDLYVPGLHNFLANGIIVHNCIDEFDKMREEDRSAIHEALEQQTISIAKAGIVAKLSARTTVIAAGNPKYGRWGRGSIVENINLPPTILSRFDLIFILRDQPNPPVDSRLARHILRVHRAADEIRPEIPIEMLKKYISYARRNIRPRITPEAAELLEKFFVDLRKQAQSMGSGEERPVPITARQLEALVRLAEAHAKMALKEEVTTEDALEAIRLITQMMEDVGYDTETGSIDVDIIYTGVPRSKQEKMRKLIELIRDMVEEAQVECIKLDDLEKRAPTIGIKSGEVKELVRKLKAEGDLFERRFGCYAPV